MPRIARLSSDEAQSALKELPGWSVADGKLRREYEFADFTHAFGFMAAAATVIEKMNHHPEWFNVYGRVTVDLWTHSEGGITPLDVELAGKLEAIAKKLS
jgi:4a-hydroxytetrahydrobiopterin dehydratase